MYTAKIKNHTERLTDDGGKTIDVTMDFFKDGVLFEPDNVGKGIVGEDEENKYIYDRINFFKQPSDQEKIQANINAVDTFIASNPAPRTVALPAETQAGMDEQKFRDDLFLYKRLDGIEGILLYPDADGQGDGEALAIVKTQILDRLTENNKPEYRDFLMGGI